MLKLGVRTSNVSVLLSVLCLVIALSDCIIVSNYSDGELLLTRIHNYVLFLSTIIIIIIIIIFQTRVLSQ